MKFGLEVFVNGPKGIQEWTRLRPSGSKVPYEWDNRAIAERYAKMSYGNDPRIVRVVEIQEPETR